MASPLAVLQSAMKNMKRSVKADDAPKECCVASPDTPQYPWGLEIRLEKDSLKNLGLAGKDFEIGAKVTVLAKCEVISIRTSAGRHDESETVELQITDMSLDRGQEKK